MNELVDKIKDHNPNSIFIKPSETYDQAIEGYDENGRVIYSVSKIIDSLVSQGMTEDDAKSYYHYNIKGTFSSLQSSVVPIFMHTDFYS